MRLPTALLVALLTGAVPAQESLDRRVEFIRALARDLGFVSLAQEEADRVLQSGIPAGDAKLVEQLGIEIALQGAKAIRNDRERQRRLFEDAVDRSQRFTDRHRGDPATLPARITLTEACYEFGRFLTDELEIARSERPDQVPALEAHAAAVMQRGKDSADAVMADLAGAAETDIAARLKYHLAWLCRGVLLREQARAVERDRDYLAESARSTLLDLAITAGEETVLGMRALFESSQVDEVLGQLEPAAANYRDTIGAIFEALTEQDPSGGARDLLGAMLQEAYDRLTTALLELGRPDDVVAAVQQFDEALATLGAEEDPRFGHRVRLTHARALAESGDAASIRTALNIAAKINDAHPADVVGLEAKNILRSILSAHEALASGELLHQIAVGALQSRRYEEAVRAAKRAIGALTPEEGKRIGMRVHLDLGRAFAAQTRPLEAAFALRAGLAAYAATDADSAAAAGRLLESALRQLRRHSKDDPAFDALSRECTQLAAAVGGAASQDRLHWDAATRQMHAREYADAAASYAKVSAESPYYELAMVRQVHAWKSAKRLQQALAAATAYQAWRQGPGRSAPTSLRQLADAELQFNLGHLSYLQANGDLGGKPDPSKFGDAVARLSGYADKFGETAPELSKAAWDLLARAHVELGQLDEAEAAYSTLTRLAPQSPTVAKLATAIFYSHYENAKALAAEVKALAADAPAAKDIRERLLLARKAVVAFGRRYARAAAEPQYPILFIALQAAQTLQNWAAAEELAAKTIAEYGDDKKLQRKVDAFVRPIFGEVLLRNGKLRDAHDTLVAAEQRLAAGGAMSDAAYRIKRLLCRVLGGWREVDARGYVVAFPGLEQPAKAYEKLWNEVRSYALNARRGVADYSLPWYEFHWEAYLYASLASDKDSKYRRYARSLFEIASATDDFATLKKLGARGRDLAQLFASAPGPAR